MNPAREFRERMRQIIDEALDEADVWSTCLNCTHFNESAEVCTIAVPPSRPPARVIAFGCASFTDKRE